MTLDIGSRSLDILIALVERAGEVIGKKELVARVWPDVIVEESSLRSHVAGLRRVLGDGVDEVRYIANVPGRGYCFVAPVNKDAADSDACPTMPPAGMPTARAIRHHRLPPRLARMVGRDDTVTAVGTQLLSDRFVTLVGPGGMGKTTVAISVAHALLPAFAGEVVFVDLGSISDSTLITSIVATALGLAVHGSDPLPSVLAHLEPRRILLVLDNCEHLVESIAPLAERIFSEAPRAHILATSREGLRVEGEQVLSLPPLGTPEYEINLSATAAMAFPAVQLFMERAAAAGNPFELTDADAALVAGVCRKLDGIALAIELAASRAGALGISSTAELLALRFKFLWQARRTALPRHQTLDAMLDWSYNLLSEIERSVLRSLSVFAGHFTLEGAQVVIAEVSGTAAEIPAVVANLVGKSLVSAEAHETRVRYRLLETTRAYATTKLAEAGETDQMAVRHARYFMGVLDSDATGYAREAGAALLANVRVALEWSFSERGDPLLGIDLVLAATPEFLRLSLLAECRRWTGRAVAALDDRSRETSRELDLQKSLAISAMFSRGNDDDVRDAIQRGLNLARKLGSRAHEFELLAGHNIFLTRLGDFEGALEVAKASEDVARSGNDSGMVVVAEWMLGVSYHLVGDQAVAQRHCEAGFAQEAVTRVSRYLFGYDHRIRALVALSRALWIRGFANQGLNVARQTIREAATLDHPVTRCISLIYSAPVFLWSGDLDAAEAAIEKLLELAVKHSLDPYHAVGRGLHGELLIAKGECERGSEWLREALDVLMVEQHLIQAPEFATRLAEGLAAQGRFHEALVAIEQAITQRARSGASFDMPDILRVKALILLSIPRADRSLAYEHLERSLGLARAQSALSWELRAAIARLEAQPLDGDKRQARDTLEAIYGRFTEGFETPDLRAAKRLLNDYR
jgi:predicted ATPase/DNA-binding winged helix-turn-helix (wHTH) protein